jgi:hypothetical protein
MSEVSALRHARVNAADFFKQTSTKGNKANDPCADLIVVQV